MPNTDNSTTLAIEWFEVASSPGGNQASALECILFGLNRIQSMEDLQTIKDFIEHEVAEMCS